MLPLSAAATLPEAFEEWSFTENTIDHEEPIEMCQLCEHEELRYHFEIRNAITPKTLWVGSKCILKFGLSVFEDDIRLTQKQTEKKLDRLMQKMRLESCLRALKRLAKTEDSDILENALAYYEKNKFLTSKFAFVVLWRLQHNKIDHSPSFFKVSLKKQKCKDDLQQMQPSRVHTIWPALSSAQRKLAIEMGHTQPNAT
jgi:hypothetical protein